jgi:hypothetical protein
MFIINDIVSISVHWGITFALGDGGRLPSTVDYEEKEKDNEEMEMECFFYLH